jgi:RNA polymerase sigma factor (sigma-70 family)
MSSGPLGDWIGRLRRDGAVRAAVDTADAILLERFAGQHDENAFAVLVHRHGPLVFAVCRSLLRDSHDAEDAFQATFLVLVRKAGSIRPRAPLAHWLYGVAYRVAARARALAARRRARERPGVELVAAKTPAEEHELRPVLHEEINRLPDKYRVPIVLCYLQGRTQEEAARLLAWPVGTVKGRLARARELMRRRLERRGLALSVGALASAPGEMPATPAVPAALVDATLKTGLSIGAGGRNIAAAASASVAALTQGELKSMLLSKLTTACTVSFLAIMGLSSGGALLGYRGLGTEPHATTQAEAASMRFAHAARVGQGMVQQNVLEVNDAEENEAAAKEAEARKAAAREAEAKEAEAKEAKAKKAKTKDNARYAAETGEAQGRVVQP